MNIPYIDLNWQWNIIKDEFLDRLPRLFENSAFCLGPEVTDFEKNFASYIGTKYAVGVNSGTSALHISLIAAGIKPGDKVLIPTFTFIATAWAVVYIGAIPVFCDIEEDSYLINLEDAEDKVDDKVRAIIPVHLYGQAVDMNKVQQFATKHNLVVIEDAAQAHGVSYKDKKIGSFGLGGCFSFYPSKNLGAAGEGGLITTNDKGFAEHLLSLRSHGEKIRYRHDEIGYNYRMEGIQALVLNIKLKYLDNWNKQRKKIAAQYIEVLKSTPLMLPVKLQADHIYNLFVVQTDNRDALRQFLSERNIATAIHYPISLHEQACFKYLNSKNLAIAENVSKKCLSLPIFPGMDDFQVSYLCKAINEFF